MKAAELEALQERWEQEKALAAEMHRDPGADRKPRVTPLDKDALRETLTATSAKLHALQGEEPLIYPVVDGQAVGEVVAGWTGIPIGRMQSNEIRTVLNLQETMEQRIVGQSHALEAVAQAIQTSRAGLTDPRKPIGVFLMVGTSGTGKTETALTLADLLYGGEQNMTVINMTEFKEEHKVSLLMGSPPGYVGYGEGGVLTEAVRRRPYSVILLDEMEKAHPGVQDIFFQVFDKGNMKDGEGRDIDFKNTVIIMTSNAGTDLIAQSVRRSGHGARCRRPGRGADAGTDEDLQAGVPGPRHAGAVFPAVAGHHQEDRRAAAQPRPPAGAGVVRGEILCGMTSLVDTIAARCTETSSGARNVEKILSRTLLPELSAEVLSRLAEGGAIDAITVGVDTAGSFQYAIN